jgi:hypothetical protein
VSPFRHLRCLYVDSEVLSRCCAAVLQLENSGSLGAVLLADSNDFRLSSVVEFVGLCLPDPACETVVVQTGIGHDKYVIVRVDQRQTKEPGAAVGTVSPLMDGDRAIGPPSSVAMSIACCRSIGTADSRSVIPLCPRRGRTKRGDSALWLSGRGGPVGALDGIASTRGTDLALDIKAEET